MTPDDVKAFEDRYDRANEAWQRFPDRRNADALDRARVALSRARQMAAANRVAA